MRQKTKALMSMLLAHTLFTDGLSGNIGRREFKIPEIPPDERIQYHGQKIKKHATKRRGNKLHDKRR
jgi:hypothetical protein